MFRAANLRIGIYNGKMVLADNSATVGRILMIFSADPHENSILIKWWKISPLARLQKRARKICTLRIVDFGQFWPIFAQKCFGFCNWKFFPAMGNTPNFQWSIRGTFEPKTPTYNPNFWPKTPFLGSKNTLKAFFRVFVKRLIKPLGKICQASPKIKKDLFPSRSYISLKFEFVCSQISP